MSNSSSDNTPARAEGRVDTVLNLVAAGLVVALVALAGWFAYSVWANSQAERVSSPASRSLQEMGRRLKKTPRDASLHVRYAEALAATGRTEEAVRELSTAIKLDPKHVGAYMDLALIALQDKDFAAAEQHLEKVLDLTKGDEFETSNPRREQALYYLGEIALEGKRYEDAVRFFKGAIRIRKDSADAYLRLAVAYKALGESDSAIKQLQIALAFDTNYAQAHYELGRLYIAQGRDLDGAQHLRIAFERAPDVKEARAAFEALGTVEEWMGKAEAGLKAGDAKKAEHDARMAQTIDPGNLAAARLLGRAYERSGRPKEALTAYEAALKLDPKDPESKAAVARLKKDR